MSGQFLLPTITVETTASL